MSESSVFQSHVNYDLTVYREFNRSNNYNNPRQYWSLFFISAGLLVHILIMLLDGSNKISLYCAIFLIILWVVSMLLQRKGGINYKRTLAANMGQPPVMTFQFCDDHIKACNEEGVQTGTITYGQIIRVSESKNLLVLSMKYNQSIIVSKENLTGGSKEEFLAFLAWRCPKWKKDKPGNGTVGKAANWVTCAITVLTLVLSLSGLTGLETPAIPQGTLTNDISYQQMAEELQAAGVTISQQAIDEMEAYDVDYFKEYGVEFYDDNPKYSKVFDLLYWEGCGFYNERTDVWTPSASGVFYFDCEVYDVNNIYGDLFIGLSAMNKELDFQNVTEDNSNANLQFGTGHIVITFTYNGQQYTLTEDYDFEWIDTTVLSELGAILAADNSPNELYVFYDGQCCLLYYGTPQQAALLMEYTGLQLETADQPN